MTQREAIERLAKWLDIPQHDCGCGDADIESLAREKYLDLLAGNVRALITNASAERDRLTDDDIVKAAVWQTHATIEALEVDDGD